ncbi:HAMP domain-containing sensor histidine kinase [uncultured Gimesia sp.]|uniref:sensor histidine kinase n=1 Tax=uncultured Gimesia sp. TaxID=1678688 RepID=UPI0030D8E2DE|tara:strand:- start:95289 stop:96716 length:1428 start_codon:yes stop_codon:yes gene_type:complete
MTRLSIRWRLTLWYGFALAVMLCVFSLVLCLLVWQQVLARTDTGLREELQEIGLEVALADSTSVFAAQASARFSQHEFYEFMVTDQADHVIFNSTGLKKPVLTLSQSTAEIPQTRLETRDLEGLGPYRIASTTLPGSFGILNVQVMTSLIPLYNDLHTLQWAVTFLLPVAVLLAIASGQFLAGRALRQVQQIVDDTNSINITCLDRRIEVSNPDDEIGKLAVALNSLIARLERAVNEIRRFTADASHEIRTPIAALRLEAESVLRSLRTPEEYAQTLAVVVEETTRLGKLADQLLNLSRHDAGIIPCIHDPVQLDALLLDVVDQLKPVATDRGVTLNCEIETVCEVLGDDISLSQVFFNILDNAIKYTQHSGRVTARLSVSQQTAVIEIQDSGIGISSDDLPHLFDRFYQADPSRQYSGGGAGLGLSIAKTVVLMHEGTIDIQSQPEHGTTVTVRLRLYTNADEPSSTPADRLTV